MIEYKLPEIGTPVKIYNEDDKPNWMFKIMGQQFVGITWNKKIHIRKRYYYGELTVRHESIHVEDQKDLSYPIFLIIYILNWIWNFIKMVSFPISIPIMFLCRLFGVYFYVGRPYRSIMFEREAYYHEDDRKYLPNKKKYDFLNFIFKKRGGNESYQ